MKELIYFLNYRCARCGTEYGAYPIDGCSCCNGKDFIKIEPKKETLEVTNIKKK